LNIVGERDARVAATIKELDAGLKQYGMPHELIIYPGAEHAFFNDTRKEVFKADAAQDAWIRALSWFRQFLV
jgi:carboxymethylenebutenolidase